MPRKLPKCPMCGAQLKWTNPISFTRTAGGAHTYAILCSSADCPTVTSVLRSNPEQMTSFNPNRPLRMRRSDG